MRKITLAAALAAALALAVSPALAIADCGIDHGNADASTLMEASTALEAVNPELSNKVAEIAKKHFPEKAAAQEHGGKEHGGM